MFMYINVRTLYVYAHVHIYVPLAGAPFIKADAGPPAESAVSPLPAAASPAAGPYGKGSKET
jgi:hypothetical protein